MVEPLFRKEAIEYRRKKLYGDVIITQPLSYKILTVILVLILLISIIFLTQNNYTKRETVFGYLVPSNGVIAIYPNNPGILLDLYVADGQHVAKGQEILKVQIDQRLTSDTNISNELIKEFNNEKSRLINSIQLIKDDLLATLDSADNNENKLKEEMESITALLETENQLNELKKSSYLRSVEMAQQGFISKSGLESIQIDYLSQQQKLQNLELNLKNKAFDLKEAEISRKGLKLRSQKDISDIENRLSNINRQIASILVEHEYIVIAPISGTITSISNTLGQRVNANIPILSIIPEKTTLEAHLYIPTRAIGFVQENQIVNIRYDAFPYQNFGSHKGKISQIANAILTTDEIPKLIPIKEPAYKVITVLENQNFDTLGQIINLKPGMLLSADVELDNRSLIEWLFEPIYSLKGKL